MRVLLVDDDATYREELTRLLAGSEVGGPITGVATVAEATYALEHAEYDVVFIDLGLGRQSGLDLLVKIRERWPRVQVVMLADERNVRSAILALHLGALEYLRKPIKASQVVRVLQLIGQQHSLIQSGIERLNPARYARALAAEGGYEVLLISTPPVHRTPEKVTFFPLDPENPVQIRDAVAEFVAPRSRAAVVLSSIEQLLSRHREEEIAELLEEIREVLEGKGPLAVGYDPLKISTTGALAVRASIAAVDAQTTIGSLSSPIRRLMLRRLAEGPCSATQAMQAARIDDSSKATFHLRNLVESGLVNHVPRRRYELTARGKGVIRVLDDINRLESAGAGGHRLFLTRAPMPELSGAASGRRPGPKRRTARPRAATRSRSRPRPRNAARA
jgi:ActR/RegA family two-component response regulator/predicted transcriptional regulator